MSGCLITVVSVLLVASDEVWESCSLESLGSIQWEG
jgi:hypothetical protein